MRLFKRAASALLAIVLLLGVSLTANASGVRAFTDSVGRTVEVSETIERVAPSGTLAQIALLAIAPDMLVGLTSKPSNDALPYLGTAADLPVLGQLYGGKGDLNLEELAAVGPQVVIDIGEAKSVAAADMDQLSEQIGIPAVHIDADTRTAGDAYRVLGALLGREEQAERIASYYEETLARIDATIARVGEANKASLLYLVGDDGLGAIARTSYHAEFIDLIADNRAVVESPSSRGTGNAVGLEQLLLWDPDVIVFSSIDAYRNALGDPLWQELSAVSSGHIAVSPFGPYNWMGFPPSVQRLLGALWLTHLLYPEDADYDLYTEAAAYFDLFYHASLTTGQLDNILEYSRFPQ